MGHVDHEVCIMLSVTDYEAAAVSRVRVLKWAKLHNEYF